MAFRTRFTYHIDSGPPGYSHNPTVVAWPTDDYLDTLKRTYSFNECIRFDRSGKSMADIIENAHSRGWSWFIEDDYWFLRFLLNPGYVKTLAGEAR